MNDNSSNLTCSITRNTIQTLLHHAMSDEKHCSGLLFASRDFPFVVQHAEFSEGGIVSMSAVTQNEGNLICAGLFHLENQATGSLLALMPEAYLVLSVSLREQGRLDLCAVYHHGNETYELPLDLIEDGQLEANA